MGQVRGHREERSKAGPQCCAAKLTAASSQQSAQPEALRPAPRPAQPAGRVAGRRRAGAAAAGIARQDDGWGHRPCEGAITWLGVLVARAREVRELHTRAGKAGRAGPRGGEGEWRVPACCEQAACCGLLKAPRRCATQAAATYACIPPSCTPCLHVEGSGSAQRRCCAMRRCGEG